MKKMFIKLNLAKDQIKTLKDYAKSKNLSISETIKIAILSEIGDWRDARDTEASIKECEETGIIYTHEEMKNRLGLN